jgi:hypothetical protein
MVGGFPLPTIVLTHLRRLDYEYAHDLNYYYGYGAYDSPSFDLPGIDLVPETPSPQP